MNYLSIENLSKSFGARVLFENLTMGIDKGQKVAFVAKNGTGKSTFLRIIAGLEGYDSGEIAFRNGIKVGYLPQSPKFNAQDTVLESVLKSDSEEIKAIKYYESLVGDESKIDQLNKAIERMDALKAWDIESKVQEILSKLNLTRLDQKVSELSGGQEKRVALARVLIEKADFLILDEPTNHLDLEMIEWLEDYLADANVTLFMVTHDRYFLERVCNEIIELDNKQLYRYKGNYAYFLSKREERLSNTQSTINKAQNLYRKELEWMRRMPRARGTKAKYRQDAFFQTKEIAHQKLDDGQLEMEVNMQRLGNKIIEMHHVRKSFGDLKILDDFSYTFKRRERIGIVGKNGTGKSTFLNLITGLDSDYTGKINIGETVVFGYYNQKGLTIKKDKLVIEVIRDIAEYIPLTKGKKLSASQLLETFLFPKDMHYNRVEKLSGGEKRRLYLLTILIKNPNFLILDEPTNDLDILTLNVLENFLENFPGCIVVVSHDRFFMDKVVDHLFVFEGDGKVKDFNGKYTDYFNEQPSYTKKENKTKSEDQSDGLAKESAQERKLSYNEKKEYNRLEKEIEKLELQKQELTKQMLDSTLSNDELVDLSTEFGALEKRIEEKTDRWLELSEYL